MADRAPFYCTQHVWVDYEPEANPSDSVLPHSYHGFGIVVQVGKDLVLVSIGARDVWFKHASVRDSREKPKQVNEAARRKATPVFSGVLAYFPDALEEIAKLSKIGNDQHNPGQTLHWAKEKSTDEPDALVRHLLDYARDRAKDELAADTDGVPHLARVAWRALALLQRACDKRPKSAEQVLEMDRHAQAMGATTYTDDPGILSKREVE